MNRFMAAIMVLSLATPVGAQRLPEVHQFMDERWRAWDTRDAEAMGQLYADDATAVDVTGEWHSGRKAITAWYAQLFSGLFPSDLGPRRCEPETIQMIGDDVAVITVECKWYDIVPAERAKGRRLPIRHSVATHVLARGKDGWKMVAFRNVPVWNPFSWEGTNR